MQLLIVFICALFTTTSFAKNLTTQIHSIDVSSVPGQPTLLYLTSGHVAKFSQGGMNKSSFIQMAQESGAWLNITLNENREIETMTEVPAPYPEEAPVQFKNLDQGFTPSVLGSMEWARLYFKEARYNAKESQCFNRAHVWTHDWRINHKLYSSKVFIFFTRKYIREFDFEWWFHVAPYVHVQVDGLVKERVMDIKYARGPINVRQWTNIFMKNDAACPLVPNYSDYANFPESGHCFIMKSSMYYYQPVDLEMREIRGFQKSSWLPTEVKEAYLEAFDVVL